MTDTLNYQGAKPSFDMGRVMSRAFNGVFKNIKQILLVIVFSLIISSILSIPVYLLDFSDATALIESPIYWIITSISSVFGILFLVFISVFTDHLAFAQFTKQPKEFRSVLLRSAKLTFPILFILILYFIAVNIGTLLFIIPGVIISVGWAIIGPAYLHEEVGVFGSFGRAWELTRGYKLWVWLGTIIMGLIMLVFFSVMIGIMTASSFASMTGTDLSSTFTIGAFFAGLLMSLAMYLAFALYASFITAIYTELRELKEGPLAEEMAGVFD